MMIDLKDLKVQERYRLQEFSRNRFSSTQRQQATKLLDRVDNLVQVRQDLIEFGTMLAEGDVASGLEFADGSVPMVGVLFDPTCGNCTFLTRFLAEGAVCYHHA